MKALDMKCSQPFWAAIILQACWRIGRRLGKGGRRVRFEIGAGGDGEVWRWIMKRQSKGQLQGFRIWIRFWAWLFLLPFRDGNRKRHPEPMMRATDCIAGNVR